MSTLPSMALSLFKPNVDKGFEALKIYDYFKAKQIFYSCSETDKKLAYFTGAVRLTDGQGTLTTPSLEYDMARKIGTYKNSGKVVNKTTTVTSEEGIYYTDIKDIYFKKNVVMKDPANTVKTDSIL